MDIKKIEDTLSNLGFEVEEGNPNESTIKIAHDIEKTPERLKIEEEYMDYLKSI